jgi:hypothetical protein
MKMRVKVERPCKRWKGRFSTQPLVSQQFNKSKLFHEEEVDKPIFANKNRYIISITDKIFACSGYKE